MRRAGLCLHLRGHRLPAQVDRELAGAQEHAGAHGYAGTPGGSRVQRGLRRAPNGNDGPDFRSDIGRHPLPRLPHLRHEDPLPQHGGAHAASVGAPRVDPQGEAAPPLRPAPHEQDVPAPVYPDAGEQPVYI